MCSRFTARHWQKLGRWAALLLLFSLLDGVSPGSGMSQGCLAHPTPQTTALTITEMRFSAVFSLPTAGGSAPIQAVLGWLAALAGLGLLACAASNLPAFEDRFEDCMVQVFDQAPVGMALIDSDTTLRRFNQAFAELLGYDPQDLLSKSVLSLIHTDDRESFNYLRQEVLQGHASSSRLEMRCLHKTGRLIWVRTAFSVALTNGHEPLVLLHLDDYTIQKEMEQAFWEQILRNEMILQTATDGFCLFGLDGTIIEVNAAFAAITGYPQESLTGAQITVLQDSRQSAIMQAVPQAMETGSKSFETTVQRKDGTTAALAASLNLIDMGSQRFMFLSIRDVTEMNSAQQALRQSRQMLQLVLDAIPTRVFWKDRELRFLGCNRAFAGDTGLADQKAVVGMTDYEMPWKAQAEAYRAADLKVINEGITLNEFEEPQQRTDGNRYWLRTSKMPLRDPDGSIIGVMGTYEDVTERKHARDRLEQSETRLQSIFNNAAAGILLLDAEGNFLHFNRQWADMLGYEMHEIYALDLWEVTLPEERAMSRRKLQMLATREIDGYTLEKRYLRKDGSTLWARVSVSAILDDSGKLETAVAMITDITERKQAEQAMYASEARYRSLFEDMPIGLFELDFSGVKQCLEDLRRREPTFVPRDYFYGHPDAVTACLDCLNILNVNHAGETLFEATSLHAISTHLLRAFKEETFEDFRLILINLAENQLHITLDTMVQTLTGNQRSVNLHITVMPQYEATWGRVLIAAQDITTRLEAQLALRESEERYRRLFEDVPISLWEEDFSRALRIIQGLQAQGITNLAAHFNANPDVLDACITAIHVLDVNHHTLQMYNSTSKEQFIGPLSRVLPNAERAALGDELVALADGQYEISVEVSRVINGEERYLAVGLSVAPGYENTWGRVLVSLTDITRLKQAEAAEHEQRTLAEALRDTAAAMVSSLDPDVVLSRILDNLGKVVPHDAANIGLIDGRQVRIHSWRGYDGKIANQALHLSMPLEFTSFQQMQVSGQPILISDVEQDSDWVCTPETEWVKSYVGVPIRAHGEVVGFLNLDSDIPSFFNTDHVERLQAFADQAAIAIENAQLYDTIRKHAAELQTRVEQRTTELERERAQLQAILDAMGEGVIYTENEQIRYVNDQLLDMIGYDLASLQGSAQNVLMNMMQLEGLDLQYNVDELLNALFERRIWRGDARVTRSDDTEFDANLTITLVGTPGDQPVSIVTLVRDVSRERALDAQKDRFIANASHELRTPIANMKMRLYLLEKQPDRHVEHMQVLHYVTGRMEKLVEELLDVSRFERGVINLDRQIVDLRLLVAHMLTVEQATAQQKGLKLIQILPEETLNVNIDPNRITQVLNNLLANAFNYTPAGGEVTVLVERDALDAIVRVIDTGIGIPDDALEQIFEPFYRVNEAAARGTGLGLTISREIVDLHEGSLVVDSKIGLGSTFTVRLPLVASTPVVDAPPAPEAD